MLSTNKKIEKKVKEEIFWHEIQWILISTCGYSDEAANKITDFVFANYILRERRINN